MNERPSDPQTIPEPDRFSDLLGRVIGGRYKVLKLVGRGGMGAVYEAEHLAIGRRVAIKFVDRAFATDETVVGRFAREARAASSVESAHIVSVFDGGTDDGRPYLVMELLSGEDLGQRLRRLGRLPPKEALHVTAQVLRGLAHAHAAGIVHRDLKPDNIFLVSRDGDSLFAKILDFGVSKIERARTGTAALALTREGTAVGTPLYMSPEQAQAMSGVDARTDLWALGAILYECLTGRPPHTGDTYEQIIVRICMEPVPDVRRFASHVSPAVAAFLTRALERDRERRFPSALAMLKALHDLAPEERARVPLDSIPQTLRSGEAGELDEGARPSSPIPGMRATDAAVDARSPRDDGRLVRRRARARRSLFLLVLLAAVAMLTGLIVMTWIVQEMVGPRATAHSNAPTVEAGQPAVEPSDRASGEGRAGRVDEGGAAAVRDSGPETERATDAALWASQAPSGGPDGGGKGTSATGAHGPQPGGTTRTEGEKRGAPKKVGRPGGPLDIQRELP